VTSRNTSGKSFKLHQTQANPKASSNPPRSRQSFGVHLASTHPSKTQALHQVPLCRSSNRTSSLHAHACRLPLVISNELVISFHSFFPVLRRVLSAKCLQQGAHPASPEEESELANHCRGQYFTDHALLLHLLLRRGARTTA